MKRIVIIGAGIAGLSFAKKLFEKGKRIVLIEKEKKIGGLSRSFIYNNVVFDIGPHRFYTEDKEVTNFIQQVLKNNAVIIRRHSGIWFAGKYYDWPFNYKALFKLPLSMKISACRDVFVQRNYQDRNYEDFLSGRYGKTIYENFFVPYTKKFLGLHPKDIHFDWGRESIDRAVIDRRIKVDNIADLIKSMFIFRPIKTEFIYPEKGGMGAFSQSLATQITDLKEKILTENIVKRIIYTKNRISAVVTNKNLKIPLKYLVWSAPITELMKLLGMGSSSLKYLDTILFNIEIDHFPELKYQWCYFGNPDVSFVRYSIPFYFSKYNVSEREHGICVEVTLAKDNMKWKNPLKKIDQIIKDLIKVNVIPNKNVVKNVHIERISNTYPVYDLYYKDELNRIRTKLSCFKNLFLLGRCGSFWYNNMDHSIRQALDLAEKIGNAK